VSNNQSINFGDYLQKEKAATLKY
jgi:hypothetical protein